MGVIVMRSNHGPYPATNRYWIVGPVALIDVSTAKHPRAVALIDSDDLARVIDGRGRWSAYQPRHVVYAGRRSGETSQRMHHVVRPPIAGMMLDHRHGDGLDNRKQSLRHATTGQNGANASKAVGSRTSAFKGVSWRAPSEKWQAELTIKRRRIYLGLFSNEEEAAREYDTAAAQHFGEFARLNFPNSAGA